MARKSQPKQQEPGQAGDHYSAHPASISGYDRADAIEKAKTIDELVAPVLSFPITAPYTLEVEISNSEDMLGIIAKPTIQTAAQDRKYLNRENQRQHAFATVARSWDLQFQIQQGQYSSQDQTPLAVWENQSSVEEPFNDVGEVAFESAGGQQGEGYDVELRRRRRQKRGSF